jgi:hypothetical protein
MSLSNELQRWAEYGNLTPKGKSQVLDFSDRAGRLERAIGNALKSPLGEPLDKVSRRVLADAIRDKEIKT